MPDTSYQKTIFYGLHWNVWLLWEYQKILAYN